MKALQHIMKLINLYYLLQYFYKVDLKIQLQEIHFSVQNFLPNFYLKNLLSLLIESLHCINFLY